jgi:GTP-binding protein
VSTIVAIVGRPNVGKSTLFNRLAGQSLAIVHDAPGVTRDRHYADAHVHGRELTLVDTGGFDPGSDDPMGQGIARQVQAAVEEADVVVCVLDATSGTNIADHQAVDLLRRSSKPVIYVANKADGDNQRAEAMSLYSLGVPNLIPVSALHGLGMAQLGQAIAEGLPPALPQPELPIELEDPDAAPAVDEAPHRACLALIGRPNAGKSSLFNHLAGTERSLVDDRPGTTRDPVDLDLTFNGHDFRVVDTAGIRRRARVDRGVEAVSVIRSLRAIDRAEVVVLMCDAAEGMSDQDARLLGLSAERGRAIVVALNKMDLLDATAAKKAMEQAQDKLRFATWAKIHQVSAKTGRGVKALMTTAAEASRQYRRRIGTGELNRFFETVLERRAPPTSGGKAPRIYYVTQVASSPPVFVVKCSSPEAIQTSYRRFVTTQIREHFDFHCVPLIVHWRPR